MQSRDGRATGVLLLCVALLAVAVLGRVQQPLRVDGLAAAEPPGAPPTVGDCLLDLPTDVQWPAPDELPSSAPLGGCDRPHGGEVYAVVDGARSAEPGAACWTDDQPGPLAYLGYPPVTDDGWTPSLSFFALPVGPDDRQRAAGQTWVACVIAVPVFTTDTPLTGSLAGAHRTGTVPPQFGVCLDGADPMHASGVSCDAVHAAQQFGQSGFDAPGPAPAALEAGCRELIADGTGNEWLTDGDGLRPEVVVYLWPPDTGSPVEAALPLATGESAWASCSLVATDGRKLNGSLLGLGDAPVPWAG